ncbi:MAG: hypothetical protein E6767_18740 [Dysgonomonas sp.]|nr:hypothetical protein [Dysgonomonas sp.]
MTFRNEEYGYTDTFILGMCITTLLLSISSLFVASGTIALFLSLITCVIYWIIQRRHLLDIINRTKVSLSQLSAAQLIGFVIVFFSLGGVFLWTFGGADPSYYHYQAIRWYEEYPVIPGLANLEDRLGFNSNYMLISSIFTFRFLFDQPVYTLQALLATYMTGWVLYECIRSNYEVKRILLVLVWAAFIFNSLSALTDTSTDVIPNLIIFYLAAKIILYPHILSNKYLLFIWVPVAMVTFKLSVAFFALISLYSLYLGFKNKEVKAMVYIMVVTGLFILTWLIRNVILSGYLIYPLHEIDIFSFDWKIPVDVAIEQRRYIKEIGEVGIETVRENFKFGTYIFGHYFMYGVSLLLVALSPLVVLFSFLKKKVESSVLYLLYFVLALGFLYWYFSAPDIRFAFGTVFAIIFLSGCMLISSARQKIYPKIGLFVFYFSVIFYLSLPIKRTYNYYYHKLRLCEKEIRDKSKPISSLWIEPYSYKDQFPAYNMGGSYSSFKLGEITIYKTGFLPLDKIPCVSETDAKIQPIDNLEVRGNRIEDGFKPKY